MQSMNLIDDLENAMSAYEKDKRIAGEIPEHRQLDLRILRAYAREELTPQVLIQKVVHHLEMQMRTGWIVWGWQFWGTGNSALKNHIYRVLDAYVSLARPEDMIIIFERNKKDKVAALMLQFEEMSRQMSNLQDLCREQEREIDQLEQRLHLKNTKRHPIPSSLSDRAPSPAPAFGSSVDANPAEVHAGVITVEPPAGVFSPPTEALRAGPESRGSDQEIPVVLKTPPKTTVPVEPCQTQELAFVPPKQLSPRLEKRVDDYLKSRKKSRLKKATQPSTLLDGKTVISESLPPRSL